MPDSTTLWPPHFLQQRLYGVEPFEIDQEQHLVGAQLVDGALDVRLGLGARLADAHR